MPQFFVSERDREEGLWVISGSDYRHLISVRRAAAGDIISLRDEHGSMIEARIEDISESRITASTLSVKTGRELSPDLALYAAFVKGKDFDGMVRRAVELGVGRIVPIITERTIVRPSGGSKSARIRQIAAEAAKQSLRPMAPEVCSTMIFSDAVKSQGDVKIIASPSASTGFKDILSDISINSRINLMIGPEGGFSDREINEAESFGWKSARFGLTQLRSGTACTALASIIIYEWYGNADKY
jgi:16S rRNA (uracil1498-N3)-methyltransferase